MRKDILLMRPLAPLGLLLLLGACSSTDGFTNPFSGFGDYVGDTITFRSGPNRPVPESDNIRRVMGQDVELQPLLPDSGNIWPGTPRADPTMKDGQPGAAAPKPAASGVAPAATPTPVAQSSAPTVAPAAATPTPIAPAPTAAAPAPAIASAASIPSGTAVPTTMGSALITSGQNGIMSYTLPSGATGRAINNGNGTMTLIGADGTVLTAPAPR